MFAALRRPLDWLIVILCIGGILLPAVAESHARWNDDIGCASGPPSPDRTPTHVGATTAQDASSHCALCHWLRAIASALPGDAPSVLLGLAPHDLEIAALVWWHDQLLPLDRPSRAPPAS